MEKEDNKIKNFIKNNFLYFIIGFTCIAYTAYGLLQIETTGKTIIEIIGQGAVIFLIAYFICRLFSMQGLLAGDRKQDVISTNTLHAKCVSEIDPYINQLDDWCDKENTKTLQKIRKQILNKEGLRYQDCFDEEGVAKDITFPLKEIKFEKKNENGDIVILSPKDVKKNNPSKYRNEVYKVKLFNEHQRAKMRAFKAAIKVKITLLSTDAITATTVKANDPHNLGMDRKKYQKLDAKSDLISKLIMGMVFSYFSFSFIIGWSYLISAIIQVAIFLLFGGIRWVQSYYFVVEDLRRRTVRQINYLQRFKCDVGLATKSDIEKENKVLGGIKNVNTNNQQQ